MWLIVVWWYELPARMLLYSICYIVETTGREDLTKQCQLDREGSNVAVHRPVVVTADKNAADVKTTQKDDSDGMSYQDDEVWFLARDSIYAIARYMPLPVRPSVRLSHGWISQRRLKLGSRNLHHRVAPWL